MIEIPQQFGPDNALVGVLTRPDHEAIPLAFVVFNAGVVSRQGPHRINVKLARALARYGVSTLRFDLGGLGDSRGIPADGDFRTAALRDLRLAMDHLEREHGLRHFAMLGNCSGAVHAYWAAQADSRIVGVMMFDGYWYRTRWTRWVRHWKRFRSLPWGAIGAALQRRLLRHGRPVPAATSSEAEGDQAAANPPKAQFAAAIQSLVDRGTEVYLVYSGSVVDYYSYAGQFRQVFAEHAFMSKVRTAFLPDVDHTLLPLAGQKRMIDLVIDWLPAVRAAALSRR